MGNQNQTEGQKAKPNQQKSGKKKKPSPFASPSVKTYARYSGMAFQMLFIILLGVFFGKKLDAHFQTEKPYFTMGLSLFAVFAALYISLKDFFKPTSR